MSVNARIYVLRPVYIEAGAIGGYLRVPPLLSKELSSRISFDDNQLAARIDTIVGNFVIIVVVGEIELGKHEVISGGGAVIPYRPVVWRGKGPLTQTCLQNDISPQIGGAGEGLDEGTGGFGFGRRTQTTFLSPSAGATAGTRWPATQIKENILLLAGLAP